MVLYHGNELTECFLYWSFFRAQKQYKWNGERAQ